MVELREITMENLDDILSLKVFETQERFVSTTAYSLAQAWVFKETAFPFAVYADQILVGFLMLGYYQIKNQYTVWKLLIDEQYQHRGYGREAMKLAIKYIKEHFQAKEVYLAVSKGNTAAEKLYTSLGFRKTGEANETGFEMKRMIDEKGVTDKL